MNTVYRSATNRLHKQFPLSFVKFALRSLAMPELRLDLDVMESNAKRIATQIASLGKLWRPHVKAHCQPRIAQTLVELGATGVTAATVDEVEVMSSAGIPSILFAHIAVEQDQLNRLSKASQQTDLLICADHFVQAERYSKTAQKYGSEFRVLIDIDIGMERSGCRPRVDATQLALAVDKLPGLRVAGIFGYEGHLLTISDAAQKERAIFESIGMLQQSRDAIVAAGIECNVVSAGGSGSFWITGRHPAVTELQAGGGIFGDLFYSQQCGLSSVQPALTVVASVVSRPCLERAIINAGRKAINPFVCPPQVADLKGASISSMNAEHTSLNLSGPAKDLRIGEQVALHVGYSDHSILMHRTIEVYRGESKVDTWDVIRRTEQIDYQT